MKNAEIIKQEKKANDNDYNAKCDGATFSLRSILRHGYFLPILEIISAPMAIRMRGQIIPHRSQ